MLLETITSPLENLTFFNILLAVISISLLRVLWGYVKLLAYHRKLRKAGAVTHFEFPLGYLKRMRSDVTKGDAFIKIKELVKEDPKIRLFASHMLSQPIVWLIDPALIKIFLSDQNPYVKSSIYDIYAMLFGKGLLFANGAVWKKHRKIISQNFRFDFISSQIPNMVEITERVLKKEIKRSGGKHVNIMKVYQEITGAIVCSIFFGDDLTKENIDGMTPTAFLARLMDLVDKVNFSFENQIFGSHVIKRGMSKSSRQVVGDLKKFDDFCAEIIEERRRKLKENNNISSSVRKDFLDLILELESQSNCDEDHFTNEEILHEFIIFFSAGMDTTGHVIAMMTYYFQQESQKNQEILLEDVRTLAEAGPNMPPELLGKCETLQAFIKETLRMAGPVPFFFGRKALNSHHIGDIWVPKGTVVNCLFVANHSNPDYYKDQEKFNLNRWIKGHEDYAEKAAKDPYIFLPFSAGPRNCVGQHLAQMEMKIVFSIFTANYNITIPEEYKLRMSKSFLYEPYDTIYVDMVERNTK